MGHTVRDLIRTLANHRYTVLPQRLVHGAAVMRNYRFLLDSQYWSADRLAEYQLRALQRLITHAYDQSPFYLARFEQARRDLLTRYTCRNGSWSGAWFRVYTPAWSKIVSRACIPETSG